MEITFRNGKYHACCSTISNNSPMLKLYGVEHAKLGQYGSLEMTRELTLQK
jgi:hypothetical protein